MRIRPETRRWLIVAVIFLAIVFNYVDRQIVSVLKPMLKSEFNIDDDGYALIVNVFTICYALMYPVAGWLVDRFGAGKVMLYGGVDMDAGLYRRRDFQNFRTIYFFQGIIRDC